MRFAFKYRLAGLLRDFLRKWAGVAQRVSYRNVYHCCTQKTASQWFKGLFLDQIFYEYTGLDVYSFVDWRQDVIREFLDDGLPMIEVSTRLYEGCSDLLPLPDLTVGAHLYVGYETYMALPKPANYRTFFILRDPRDIVVSWYFSTLYSHGPSPHIERCRRALEEVSLEDGLRYSIDTIEGFGLFDGQKSWVEGVTEDESARIFFYEDFAADNLVFCRELFEYLDVSLPDSQWKTLLKRNSFETYTGGREAGKEDIHSHYRRGVAGDWERYFTDRVISHFQAVTGDLVEILGYER